jgi:uncharacterized membrane protein YfcA
MGGLHFTDLALVAVVLVAFTVEAALGFGATIVAVSIAAFLVPIPHFLPSFVMVNVALSLALVVRSLRHVDALLLLGRVVPLMALGLPIGLLGASRLDPLWMRRGFGAFLLVLTALELTKRAPAQEAPSVRPPLALADGALLTLGGAIHGAFATGGPLVVWVLGRQLPDKSAFRATLSALWVLLNGALLASYGADGALDAPARRRALTFVPALALGLGLGEWAHRRVPQAAFRRGVFVLLGVAGALLVVRR